MNSRFTPVEGRFVERGRRRSGRRRGAHLVVYPNSVVNHSLPVTRLGAMKLVGKSPSPFNTVEGHYARGTVPISRDAGETLSCGERRTGGGGGQEGAVAAATDGRTDGRSVASRAVRPSVGGSWGARARPPPVRSLGRRRGVENENARSTPLPLPHH